MRLVVIESPYAGMIEKNTRYARLCMRDCINRGEAPTASHLLYTQEGILDENNPEERRLGIACGFAWMAFAECVAVYTDLGRSPGMEHAIKVATSLNLDIEYRKLPIEMMTELCNEFGW